MEVQCESNRAPDANQGTSRDEAASGETVHSQAGKGGPATIAGAKWEETGTLTTTRRGAVGGESASASC
jgi:hypothetical protein